MQKALIKYFVSFSFFVLNILNIHCQDIIKFRLDEFNNVKFSEPISSNSGAKMNLDNSTKNDLVLSHRVMEYSYRGNFCEKLKIENLKELISVYYSSERNYDFQTLSIAYRGYLNNVYFNIYFRSNSQEVWSLYSKAVISAFGIEIPLDSNLFEVDLNWTSKYVFEGKILNRRTKNLEEFRIINFESKFVLDRENCVSRKIISGKEVYSKSWQKE